MIITWPISWLVYQWRNLLSSSFCPEVPIGVFITLYLEAPVGVFSSLSLEVPVRSSVPSILRHGGGGWVQCFSIFCLSVSSSLLYWSHTCYNKRFLWSNTLSRQPGTRRLMSWQRILYLNWKQGRVLLSIVPKWTSFFFKKLEDINPFSGTTDTPVLDFWWRLLWVSKLG